MDLLSDGDGVILGNDLQDDVTDPQLSSDMQNFLRDVVFPDHGPDAHQAAHGPVRQSQTQRCQGEHGLEADGGILLGESHGNRLFPRALTIAGMLHIIHSCTEYLDLSLSDWEWLSLLI